MATVNFAGIASGIDSTGLIQATISQQRKAQVAPLQKKISELSDTNSAFSKLRDLLSTLKEKASVFRVLNGGALSKTSSSSDETIATASATSAAVNGTYTLNVLSKANSGTISFNDRFSSSTAAINSSINNGASSANRTVSFTLGTGGNAQTVNVELTNSTTLTDFVTSFNSQTTQAEASVVNVGTTSSPSYALVISSTNSGTDKGNVAVSVGSEITSAGTGAFSATTLSQATNAQFTLSGITGTITRSTNAISDVLAGVTLSLNGTGTSTVTVGDDAKVSTSKVKDFVSAYNDVVKFIREQDQITQEGEGSSRVNVFGPLSSTSLDENLLSNLRSAFTSASLSGNEVNTLADLGVKTERDGTLSFSTETFIAAVGKDSASAKSILENLGETLASTAGTIATYTQFNGFIDVESRGNDSLIQSYNDRITRLEESFSKQEGTLTGQFSRLEALIGKLNSQQNALSGLL